MKELLTLVSLLISGVVAEGPYPPSGWRPDGPAFVIPERTQFVAPQQQYLPVEPRRPLTPNNSDEDDVSVQGLPSVEPQPIFEVSPINGQQFTGPSINADIGRLNPSFQQAQYQQQLEKARQFARQREFESTRARIPNNGLPNQQSPRQFASQTTTTSTARPDFRTTQAETTTEALGLNEGETLETNAQKDKVEVTKQNLQEYPPEIFLNPLAQLKLQPQFAPLQQLGQLRAPLFYQPAQLQDGRSPGFDGPAHLSALPSVLAQRELLAQQAQIQGQGFAQSPIIVQQEPAFIQDPVNQYRPIPRVQPVLPIEPVDPAEDEEPDQNGDRDVEPLEKQPKQGQNFPKIQAQKAILQRQQINQFQAHQFQQPQFQFQPQAQLQLQPQVAQPNQFPQPQVQYQPQPQFQIQPQLAQPNQFQQPQLQFQPQAVQPNQFPQTQLQFQPQPAQPNQFPQTQLQFQPQPAQPNQFPQPQFQPQPNQFLQPERPKDVEEIEPTDQQVVYQNYQPQFYQPQFQPNQYQTPEQPLFVAQPQQQIAYPNQEQFYQNQYPQQQYPSQQSPAQDGQPLQSGLDINQQGNDIEQTEEQENEQEEEGPRVTAVATAFGARTQPRVFAQYGAPIPKVQENPGYPTTTESAARDEPQNDEAPTVAQATAEATGRRNARLRSRRVRPIFTLDRSGHLVLAQQQ